MCKHFLTQRDAHTLPDQHHMVAKRGSDALRDTQPQVRIDHEHTNMSMLSLLRMSMPSRTFINCHAPVIAR